jgi:sialidase-1
MTSRVRRLCATVLLALWSCVLVQPARALENRSVVFETDAAYVCYKIPYLVRMPSGKLLAMAEARGPADAPAGTSTRDCMDWDITDAVAKTSLDNGETWSAMRLVIPGRYGAHTVAGNMAPVVDEDTGRIWMPFTRGNVEMWMTFSDDEGETWAAPWPLARQHSTWTWVAFGPPAGLQLRAPGGAHRGRLLIPAYYSTMPIYDNGLATSNFVLLSDDHGATWRESRDVPNGPGGLLAGRAGNEAQLVELPGGEVLINSRTIYGTRLQARSADGGESWSTFERTSLPNPLVGCEGSIVAVDEQGRHLLYSGAAGPGDSIKRTVMQVFESHDAGRSWEALVTLEDKGGVSYSAMQRLVDGRIAVIYEISDVSETVFVPGKIVFELVPGVAGATANAAAFPLANSSQLWLKEDGDAFIFIKSAPWYALLIVNTILAVTATALFIVARLCPCCCCCAPLARTFGRAAKKVVRKQPQGESPHVDLEASGAGNQAASDSDASAPQPQQSLTQQDAPPRERAKRIGLLFATWLAKALLAVNLGFWCAGVLANMLFPYDDAGRWTYNQFAALAGLLASCFASGATIAWRRGVRPRCQWRWIRK